MKLIRFIIDHWRNDMSSGEKLFLKCALCPLACAFVFIVIFLVVNIRAPHRDSEREILLRIEKAIIAHDDAREAAQR